MIAMDWQSLAQLFTGRMLNSAAEGLLLTGLVWLLLRLIRRQNSGTRFAIWMLALVAVVSLPFFAGTAISAAGSPLSSAPTLSSGLLLSRSWALYLFAAWAAGAALLLARLAVGLWSLHRLRSRCTEVASGSLDPAIVALLRHASPRRPVQLFLSNEVSSPALIGFRRPAVVFPAWLLPQLSTAEMEIILLHELAHLRRGDPWTNLFQKVLKALFFFHPAVWWIESQLTLEREMACDDVVLTHRDSPRAYASVLIALAEKLHSAPALALAQTLLSRMRQMSLRVSQILDTRRPGGAAVGKPVLGAGVALLAFAVAAAPYAPRLVGFRAPSAPDTKRPMRADAAAPRQTHPAAAHTLSEGASAPPSPTLAAYHSSPHRAVRRAVARTTEPQLAHGSFATEAVPVAVAQNSAPEAGNASAAIPAAYHPRQPVLAQRAMAASQFEAQAIAAKHSTAQPAAMPGGGAAMIVIVQTTTVDASGARIWTLYIWRVGQGGAQKQLESAIALAI